jgi:PTH1 family peptidyl-tRNA hydrolase
VKYLIAGLGNPGEAYHNTRHNIGFSILDALAEKSGLHFSDKRHAWTAQYKHKGRIYVLIKPTTYVNLSGKAINYWLQKEKIPPENLLVIIDDVNLPFGTLRIRKKGGDGGHNGLKSINEMLGHHQYPRLRFGIGSDFYPGEQADYVLSEWSAEEKEHLPERIEKAIEMIKQFGVMGVNRTMSLYNNT